MKRTWIGRGFAIAIFGLVAFAAFGQAVLQLWNHLMPQIFGLPVLTFWQALGLMALSWILFGRLGTPGGGASFGPHWRHRVAQRLHRLPPEEREKFLQELRATCGRPESTQA